MRNQRSGSRYVVHLAQCDGASLFLTREHPSLARDARRAVIEGLLWRVLPGTFLAQDPAPFHDLRAFALCRRYPAAVLTGVSAARLSWWPGILREPTAPVQAAYPKAMRPHAGFDITRRDIASDLVIDTNSVRYTCPALTALDLCDQIGGAAIDQLLRSRAGTIAELATTLEAHSRRRGNRRKRQLILDSRTEPWSEAERQGHRLLRTARITGWIANYEVRVNKRRYYIDIAFPDQRLAIEIDGREFHTGANAFEEDRKRQNDLVLAGWTVLRLTWEMIRNDPDGCIATIRRALRVAVR